MLSVILRCFILLGAIFPSAILQSTIPWSVILIVVNSVGINHSMKNYSVECDNILVHFLIIIL